MKRYLQFFIFIGVFTTVCLFGCKHKKEETSHAMELKVMKISESKVPIYIDMVGQITAISTVNIVPRVEGTLESCNFKEGSIVKSGQLLYKIQQSQYLNQLLATEAQLESAKASYAEAQSNLNRMIPLLKSNAVSQSSYDQAEAKEKEGWASINQEKAIYEVTGSEEHTYVLQSIT